MYNLYFFPLILAFLIWLHVYSKLDFKQSGFQMYCGNISLGGCESFNIVVFENVLI